MALSATVGAKSLGPCNVLVYIRQVQGAAKSAMKCEQIIMREVGAHAHELPGALWEIRPPVQLWQRLLDICRNVHVFTRRRDGRPETWRPGSKLQWSLDVGEQDRAGYGGYSQDPGHLRILFLK